MKMRTLRRLFRIYRSKPVICIGEYGQKTENNHRVAVSLCSDRGMMGTGLDFPANDAGHAKAESYAKTMHNITGLPVLEKRERPEKGGHMAGTI